MSECVDDEDRKQARARRPVCTRLAMLAFLGGGAVLLAVRAEWSAALDEGLLVRLRLSGATPVWALEAVRDLSALGSVTVLALAVLATTAFLLVRGWRHAAQALLLCALGAAAFSSLVKYLVDRGRPDAAKALVPVLDHSFPSGHALMSAAILLAIGGLVALTQRPGPARGLVWVVALGLVLSVGLSRPMLGAHWPSDVLAGWLFGTGWALVTLRCVTHHWPR